MFRLVRLMAACLLVFSPICSGVLLAVPLAASASTPDGMVSGVVVSLSPNDAVNVAGVDYGVEFTTSPTGAMGSGGSVTIGFPAGTGLVNSFFVGDVTTGQVVQENASISGATAVIPTNGLQISGGDKVQVMIGEATNGPAVGTNTLAVSTSSDTGAATGTYTL